MKKTKFTVHCTKLNIPIDEDEIPSVIQALTSGDVKILRQGVFNPPYFVGISEDSKSMSDFQENNKYDIRDGVISEYPQHKDLFIDIRTTVKRLSADKNPNYPFKKLN